MTRSFALPTLLAVLGAVVLAARAPEAIERDPERTPATAAERVITYALTTDHGPRFLLVGGPELIRVTAHLVLPRDAADTPGRRYAFALEATLRDPAGVTLWRRTLSVRTGHTRAGTREDGFAYEAAYAADRRFELTDAASVELALPDAPAGSALDLRLAEGSGVLDRDGLRVTALLADPRALVRAHRRVTAELASEGLRRSATAAALGDARFAAATFLPWHALGLALRDRAGVESWERLPAEGHAGRDYRPESIYVAVAPPPPPPPPDPPALAIARGQAAIVHLLGPGVASVRARSAEPVSADEPQHLALRTTWLGDVAPPPGDVPQDMPPRPSDAPDDAARASELVIPIGEAWQQESVALPPGWTSLELSTALAGVEVQVLAEDGARHASALESHLGLRPAHDVPPPRPPSFHAAPALAAPAPPPATLVPVDLRTLPLYRLGPELPALTVALAGPPDLYTRTLRLDVRALDRPAPVRLRVEFLDPAGRVLAEDELLAEPQHLSRFDRARPPSSFGLLAETTGDDDHVPMLLSALGLPLADHLVSEPAALRLVAPPAAASARIAGDTPALLEVRGVLPPPTSELAGSPWIWPYDQVCPEGQRWRYATRRRDRWFPLRALDHQDRLAAGLVVPLQAQVRRELDPLVIGAEGPWQTLSPRGAASLDILERVPAARRAHAIAGWGPGDVTLLRPGVVERLDLRRGGTGAPHLRYQTMLSGTGTLGQPIDMAINDADAPWRVTARAEARRLPRSRPVAAVRWTSGPDPVRVFANRPGLGGAPLYTARRLFRLARGRLQLSVAKQGRDIEPIHVVVYWLEDPPRAPTALRVLLDGGAPRRHGGAVARVTQGERALTITPDHPTELILPGLLDPSRAHVATFTLRLGDDLALGRHTLTLEHDDGSPVWIRVFRGAPRGRHARLPDDDLGD